MTHDGSVHETTDLDVKHHVAVTGNVEAKVDEVEQFPVSILNLTGEICKECHIHPTGQTEYGNFIFRLYEPVTGAIVYEHNWAYEDMDTVVLEDT